MRRTDRRCLCENTILHTRKRLAADSELLPEKFYWRSSTRSSRQFGSLCSQVEARHSSSCKPNAGQPVKSPSAFFFTKRCFAFCSTARLYQCWTLPGTHRDCLWPKKFALTSRFKQGGLPVGDAESEWPT